MSPMKRIIIIALLAYLFFILEFILYDLFGPWGQPQLLLLLIVFFGLYAGIRYSIAAALIAGLLKDIVGLELWGTHVFIFLCAAYVTTLVRRNFYQPGSPFSRAAVAFLVLAGSFIVEVLLYLMRHDVHGAELFTNVFFPQLLTTMVAVTFVFNRLRDVAIGLKL